MCLLHLLLLLQPVVVVDDGVLNQGGEHERVAGDDVDVDGLDVGDPGQRLPYRRADGGHCQDGRYTCGGSGWGRDKVRPCLMSIILQLTFISHTIFK